MSIYAIGDLHLDFNNEKPMDIFGNEWENHEKKIKEDWLKKVKEDDLVILLGDFSWAMKLKDTYTAFEYLNNLPGKKILLKGNHDYWWETVKKMKEFLFNNSFLNIDFLHNNSFLYENYIIAGTKGYAEEDGEIIENRQKIRLELSIQDGIKKYGSDKEIIIVLHYPPTYELLRIIDKYNVKIGLYGHLHDIIEEPKIDSRITFKLLSSDFLKFQLYKL